MKLTGKAKDDFKNYFDENYRYNWNYYKAKKTLLNAIIIEWFDTVGIYIDCGYYTNGKFCSGGIDEKNKGFVSTGTTYLIRTEATEKAIEKANEIYNKKYKENGR